MLVVLIVGFLIGEVGKVAGSLERVNAVNSIKQRYAINFRGSVHDRAISLRDLVLVVDEQAMEKHLKDIDRLAKGYADSAERMDSLFETQADTVSDQERRLLSDIKSIEARTLLLIDKVIAKRREGQLPEAQRLLLETMSQPFTEWLGSINRLIDHEEALDKAESVLMGGVVSRFGWLMAAALGTMLVLTGTVIAVTGRAIARALRKANQSCEAIGAAR